MGSYAIGNGIVIHSIMYKIFSELSEIWNSMQFHAFLS